MVFASSILSTLLDLPVWPTILVSVIGYAAYYRIRYRRYFELGNKLPGPGVNLPYPLGGILMVIEGVLSGSHSGLFQYCWEKSRTLNGFGKMWIGPRLVIGVWNPEDTEVILSSNVHLEKAKEYRFFKPWFGNGLLISSGETWRTHRKLIAPTFHLSVLKTFISVFNENSRLTVDRMKKEFGNVFDAHDYMVETTVEILLETVMGVNKKTHENAYDYGKAVMQMCDIMHNRTYKLWLRNDFIFSLTSAAKIQEKLLNLIHGLTEKVVREKKEEKRSGKTAVEVSESEQIETSPKIEETLSFGKNALIKDDLDEDLGEKKRKPFLDQLMDIGQDGVVLTDTEIKNQVDTIMFEGHDTTAAAASFFMCVMGNHPDYQDKCVEELQEIFGDSNRPATFQDTLEMKFLERCILETIRMFPPVPVIARTLAEDCKLASGDHLLPAGATVVVFPYGLHHDENLYPNHDVFNPDNFLPENVARRHYYSFIPFSAGPRSCVGRKYAMLKLKILLSTILRNFKISSKIPEDQFKLQADIILKRAEGFKVQIEPRKMIKQSA